MLEQRVEFPGTWYIFSLDAYRLRKITAVFIFYAVQDASIFYAEQAAFTLYVVQDASIFYAQLKMHLNSGQYELCIFYVVQDTSIFSAEQPVFILCVVQCIHIPC